MLRFSQKLFAGTLILIASQAGGAEPDPAQEVQFVRPLPPPLPESPGMPPGPQLLPRPPGPPLMRDYSWTYIDAPQPRRLQVHDIITVIVDEKSEVTSDNRYVRQRQGQFKAELRNFIRIDSAGNLNNAAENQPSVEGNLQSRLNSRGQVQSREGLRYRIAATVVDVLPNGTIILEARKTIRTNKDVWEYNLTGRMRAQDVLANNTVLSENIADMQIVKNETGRLRDSTKRGWLIYLYDALGPF
jgi:flagellar L-ring protein precursor FlgH